jgi:hypothetical protein
MNTDEMREAGLQRNWREPSDALIPLQVAASKRSLAITWLRGDESCWPVTIRRIGEMSQSSRLVRHKRELSE